MRQKKDKRKPAPAEAPPRLVIPELAIPPAQRELWRRHFADTPAAEIVRHKELEEARRIIDQASRRPSFDQAAKKPQAPADALQKDRCSTSRSGDQAAKKPDDWRAVAKQLHGSGYKPKEILAEIQKRFGIVRSRTQLWRLLKQKTKHPETS